jgi:hypothetical protein
MSEEEVKEEWCIIFDPRHYSKSQLFNLACIVVDYEPQQLHDDRIAIVAKSHKEALARVSEIDKSLGDMNPPFRFFYTLIKHDEIKEEENYVKEQRRNRAQAKAQRAREDEREARAWRAERGIRE